MLATFLILLPTAYTLVISNSDLADSILRKQEECVNIKKRVDNLINEEDEALHKYYYKCKEDLDGLKLEYINKCLLDPSFYKEIFPVRLSNGTLIMVSVPSKTESPNIPDTPPCSSCEGLCMVSEKCLKLLEDVNKNTDPSEISYYKMKYKNCLELLKEQKLKFIRELNLSEDVLKGDGNLSVNCKKGTVVMAVPESGKSDEGSSSTYPSVTESRKTDKEHDAPFNDISPNNSHKSGNKHSEEVNINSILKEDYGKKPLKSIGKFNIKDVSFKKYDSNGSEVLQSDYHKPGKNQIYSSNDEVSKHTSQFTENYKTNAIQPVAHKDGTSKKESPSTGEDRSRIGNTEVVTSKGSNKEISKNNDYVDKSPGNLLLDTNSQDSEKIDHTALKYNEMLSPHSKMGTTKDPTPQKEQLGDEIIEKESDCEAILREANEVLHRTVSSLQYYEKKYAECKTYLNLYKMKYAKRHGLKFKSYKTVFPIILSSGVEKLVTLPDKIADLVQHNENLPSNQGPSINELSLQPPTHNPELIISETLHASYVEGNMSTLVKFAKLISLYAGQSDRIDC